MASSTIRIGHQTVARDQVAHLGSLQAWFATSSSLVREIIIQDIASDGIAAVIRYLRNPCLWNQDWQLEYRILNHPQGGILTLGANHQLIWEPNEQLFRRIPLADGDVTWIAQEQVSEVSWTMRDLSRHDPSIVRAALIHGTSRTRTVADALPSDAVTWFLGTV